MKQKKPHATGCLVCGDSVESGARGLCSAHYRAFRETLESLTSDEAKKAFEEDAIRDGWLNPRKHGGRPAKSWSPFAELAEKARKKHGEAE